MSKAKNLNEGIVTSLADTDLVVAADNGGSLRPISVTNLMQLIRDNIKVGGRNLLTNYITSGNNNANINGNSITICANKDFYFSIKLASEIVVGETYTVSFDVKGLQVGDSWVMGGAQGANQFLIKMKNGRNHATFVLNGSQHSNTFFAFDDAERNFPNGFHEVTLSNFKLERGNVPTDWSPAPEDLSGGGNSQKFNRLQLYAVRRAERRAA